MKFRVASAIHVILAIAGIVVLFYAASTNSPFAGPAWYVVIFVLIPLLAAYGIWKQKMWGVLLGLLFFVPQCVNYVGGGGSSFRFLAPISLGVTAGDPGKGTLYIFNIFAIGMVIFLVALLNGKCSSTPNKSSQPTGSAGG